MGLIYWAFLARNKNNGADLGISSTSMFTLLQCSLCSNGRGIGNGRELAAVENLPPEISEAVPKKEGRLAQDFVSEALKKCFLSFPQQTNNS